MTIANASDASLRTSPIEVAAKPYELRFPKRETGLDQDEEWCEIKIDGEWQRQRFHDYDEIYARPGLYEQIFYDTLKCCSPEQVVGLLRDVLEETGELDMPLRVFDVGAGNGMVGEELRKRLNVTKCAGIDLIKEAAEAASRDRPGVYDDYVVGDLTALTEEQRSRLHSFNFNCLSTVATLGFGDIPPRAFANAYNLVEKNGWIAFNVKEDFVVGERQSGFDSMLWSMIQDHRLHMHAYFRYCHRFSIEGQPLHYVAMVCRKLDHVPEETIAAAEPNG
jgi:hypothetical protein